MLFRSEWHAHEEPARKGGVPPEVIEDIRHGRTPRLHRDDEQAVYDFAHALHAQKSVPEPIYRRALDALGTLAVVELTAILGYYTMMAMTLAAHEILPPNGAPSPLPPA